MENNHIHNIKPNRCSICESSRVASIGSKDFSCSGNDHFTNSKNFPHSNIPVEYYQCQYCGFAFATGFDHWTPLDYKHNIYNSDYIKAIPPYSGERSQTNAALLRAIYSTDILEKKILDYGSGSCQLEINLKSDGIDIDSYDPFSKNKKINNEYDIITAFEVIEHVVHHQQSLLMSDFSQLLKKNEDSKILISTCLIDNKNLDWWYICPRNGHISFHSKKSLSILANRYMFNVFSLSESMHFLSKNILTKNNHAHASLPSHPALQEIPA